MPHAIDTTDGVSSFADSRTDRSGRVDAWHKLGTAFGRTMTVDECLDAAHLRGWDVRKIPLRADISEIDNSDGMGATLRTPAQLALVPDRHLVLRTNPVNGKTEPLGTVGNRWTPFQNEDTTGLLGALVDEGGAHLETGAALRGGRDTFVTMRMPNHMEFRSPITGKLDVTDLYISVLNNHDGSAPLRALISPVRIVCGNTQRMAEASARASVSLRHTGEPLKRLAEVRALLGLTFTYRDVFVEQMEALIARQMDSIEVLDVIEDVWGVGAATTERQEKNRTEAAANVFEVYQTSTTVKPFYGTAAGAYNAVTEYPDHFSPLGGRRSLEDPAIRRARRTLLSTDLSDLKAKAFSALLPSKLLPV
jgi:phage/plasmid-like protein (TIGR03299 family)